MYRRNYNKCYCQKKYDENMIENTCSTYGAIAEYHKAITEDSCDCGFENANESIFPTNPMYGQSYVPIQYMDKTFTPCTGLKMGTIFPELVSPYSPCQSIEENAFIAAMNTVEEGCNK